jgi:hypothetical protein
MVTLKSTGESDEEDVDEWDTPVLVTTKLCCFASDEFLLDSESSLKVFNTKMALTNVRACENPVTMTGVQQGSKGVSISQEGEFLDIGTVFYSKDAAANILSFASQVDAGADIRYNGAKDELSLCPTNSHNVYLFTRRNVVGSGSRLYSCQRTGMDAINPTSYNALVSTVEENQQKFTKREVAQAGKARELLARMGFPSVDKAIHMVETGSNFDITGRDFKMPTPSGGRTLHQ